MTDEGLCTVFDVELSDSRKIRKFVAGWIFIYCTGVVDYCLGREIFGL